MRRQNPTRRGAALIIALVCIVILMFLLTSVLQFALMRRKASTLQINRAQASCLAESGVRLATARLAADPNYSGQTWEISPESLQGEYGATVAIEVKSAEEENVRLVSVTANYPADPIKQARITKEITVELKHSH